MAGHRNLIRPNKFLRDHLPITDHELECSIHFDLLRKSTALE
jgi:hypothetical protein